MISERWRAISRIGLLLLVLLSGISLLPFTGLSAQKLGWELYAGIYQPELNVVGADSGFPGSAFLFEGVGYPPNTLATVYVDGQERGTLTTDNQGQALFLIQTAGDDPLGQYFITLATDANTSATDDIRLQNDEPVIPPPPGWDGPTFFLDGDTLPPDTLFFPMMFQQ
jgi:hypothetical protein